MLLFETTGAQAAGAPAPDYIIPNGFLFTGDGSISFFGANPGTYTALPTDGRNMRNWNTGTNTPNVETDFTGQIGSITPVPEPSTLALTMLAGIGGTARWLRRRTTVSTATE